MKVTIEVDDAVLAIYRYHAQQHQRSLEEEIRQALARNLVAESPSQIVTIGQVPVRPRLLEPLPRPPRPRKRR